MGFYHVGQEIWYTPRASSTGRCNWGSFCVCEEFGDQMGDHNCASSVRTSELTTSDHAQCMGLEMRRAKLPALCREDDATAVSSGPSEVRESVNRAASWLRQGLQQGRSLSLQRLEDFVSWGIF